MFYDLIIEVAADKVFDLPGMNSIQSVEQSNLYEFLKYLDTKRRMSAQNE
jgi:hypothetical protein